LQPSKANFSFLKELDEASCAALLRQISPLSRALVLHHLTLAVAETQYQVFSDQEKLDIVFEMGNLTLLTEEEQKSLAEQLQASLSTLPPPQAVPPKALHEQATLALDDISDLLHLSQKDLVHLVHYTDLTNLMSALFHSPKAVKEKVLLALDATRRHQFLEKASQFQVSLFDSLEQQKELLDLGNSLIQQQAMGQPDKLAKS
jgi:flagellar motor switch protein FliG